jgi:uncharacterized membrane protein
MANSDLILPMQATEELPVVRTIAMSDLKHVLAKGLSDFNAMPTHTIFLSLIYPVIGIFLFRMTFGYNIIPLLFPLAAGFALVGPIAAIGLYELSRRREMGLDTSWRHAFDVFQSPSFPHIAGLGVVLLSIFISWVWIADALYVANFGIAKPISLLAFAQQVVSTPEGHNLIVAGNTIGFVLALLTFMISVVSFPLLLDRNIGIRAAVLTSVRVVFKNPIVMMAWALIVVSGLVLGSLPLFVGLAIVMPVLGHSTWHLYRTVIEHDSRPRPEFSQRTIA